MTFERRKNLIRSLLNSGHIKTPPVKRAMVNVPRELFVPEEYYGQSYNDTPLPIPGGQTISAPHMHAIILSELSLKEGDRVLEVGSGSGILLAYMREIVGEKGTVVGIEFKKSTYNFGKANLEHTGYGDVVLKHGDGSLGYSRYAPYDKIVVSASGRDIPRPLIKQLNSNGFMLMVMKTSDGQELIKVSKSKSGEIIKEEILPVVFVPLKGKYS